LRNFYGAIGVVLVEERHGSGPVHYAGRIGGGVLEIYPLPENETADATTRLGFVVENLEGVIESLVRQKLSPRKQPKPSEWGRRVVVQDPDGRSVEVYQTESDESRGSA
jgi:hypothetical protein